MFGKLIFSLMTLATMASAAPSQAAECTFTPRAQAQGSLSAMPPEVIGLANCQGLAPDANIVLVAKFTKSDERHLSNFVSNHGKLLLDSAIGSKVLQSKTEASGMREIYVETLRMNKLTSMLHYAFTAPTEKNGTTLLFIHSESISESRKLAPQLQKIRLNLTGPQFLAKVRAG